MCTEISPKCHFPSVSILCFQLAVVRLEFVPHIDSGEQLTLSGAVEAEFGPGDPARTAWLQRTVLELYPADPALALPALDPAQPAVALQRVPAERQVQRPGQVRKDARGKGRQ